MRRIDLVDPVTGRGRGRLCVALALALVVFAGGVMTLLSSGRHGAAQSPHAADIEGEAWIMKGVAYNTTQPTLHRVILPPGGVDDTTLYYNFNSSNQLVLSAASSRVACNGSGNSPNASSAHALCEVVLEDFHVWVGPYEIISAARVRVVSSSTSTVGTSSSFPSIQIEGLCVYIEQEYANGCRTPTPGNPVTFDRPPISGTVSYGTTEVLISNGNQLGKGSIATALRLNLFNADYTTSTGIGSVVVDIGYAMSFAGQPLPTPTPTPTITPTPTPTKTPTPSPTIFQAAVPALSRDEELTED